MSHPCSSSKPLTALSNFFTRTLSLKISAASSFFLATSMPNTACSIMLVLLEIVFPANLVHADFYRSLDTVRPLGTFEKTEKRSLSPLQPQSGLRGGTDSSFPNNQ